MATTGFTPCVASPAAKVTACPSAIPTSKKRSGCAFAKMLVLVPSGHGGGDRDHLRVLAPELGERLAEDRLVARQTAPEASSAARR
jgi:hypothetical protein